MDPTPALPLDQLRRRTSEKWSTYGDDVLPMFVAETDYELAPVIRDRLAEALELGDTGYVSSRPYAAVEALRLFARDRWGWSPAAEGIGVTTDVSVVIVETLRRLVTPGEGVVITPPVYPPFYDLLPEAGASVVEVPLLGHDTGNGGSHGADSTLDLDGIDRALAEGARGVLLCHPHNPLGLVHDRETLRALSEVVARHDGFVLSDEIHAPLAHAGVEFTPYLTVSDAAREHGVAAESASKAFDLAGLKCAFVVAESDRMTRLVRDLPEEVAARTGQFGLLATIAGLDDGRDWLDATVAAIEANVALLARLLDEHLPQVGYRPPRASYLAWLDLRALGWGPDPAAYALEHARVALVSGPTFGPQGEGHARMNLACDPSVLTEAVERLARVAAVGG